MDQYSFGCAHLHDEAVNLQESIKGIIRDFKYCEVELKYDMSNKVTSNVKYCLIGIVKEALSNVMKHSGATYVKNNGKRTPGIIPVVRGR